MNRNIPPDQIQQEKGSPQELWINQAGGSSSAFEI